MSTRPRSGEVCGAHCAVAEHRGTLRRLVIGVDAGNRHRAVFRVLRPATNGEYGNRRDQKDHWEKDEAESYENAHPFRHACFSLEAVEFRVAIHGLVMRSGLAE